MNAYAGTARLARLALRRDRVQLPVWILGSALLLAASVPAVRDEFPTQATRDTALHGVLGSPAVLVLRGIPVGSSEGAMVNFRNLAFALVLAALMSTFAVVRHTRQNEETGRAELIGAGCVGRYALLTAALVVVAGADVMLGLASAGMLVASGLPAGGALAFGAACAAAGLVFAGIAAVSAQLFRGSRAANATAATAVGVAFGVRGIGDALGNQQPDGVSIASAWPAWVSPLGWSTQVRPYGDQRWWVLLIPLVATLAFVAGAFALAGRRDLGAGLVPDRPGPATASASLVGPLGLAWRTNRGTTIGWVLGGAAFGAVVGSLGDAVRTSFAGNEGVADLMGQLSGAAGGEIADQYFGAMMNIFGVLAAAFAVQALLRLRSEESGGTAEAVLAASVGRYRWVAAHLACAVGGAAAVLLAGGFAAGLADAAAGGDEGVATLTGAGLAQLPAALTVAGFVVLAFGGLPRIVVAVAWAGLVFSLAGGLFGDLFGLPQAVRDLSPFTHVPAVPAVDVRLTPVVALVAVAAVLTAAGMVLFRRRDLTP